MLFAQTTLLSVKVSCLICFHSMIKVIDKVCEILYGHVPIFNTLLVYDAREDGTTIEEYQDKRTSCYGK